MNSTIIIVAAQAAAMSVTGCILATMDFILDIDGRSNPQPRSRWFSIRQSQFGIAEEDTRFNEGWFRDQFRCTKTSFNYICTLIESNWLFIHPPINHNANFLIRNRVAVTMYYLMHSGSIVDAAKVFGMGKSSACHYIWQIIDIIIRCLKQQFIKIPQSIEEWNILANGFENICGFPNCCFAVDGCLFEIERPYDYNGWYCRKEYPAINAQVVVDYKARILAYDFRGGSANDKSIWNYSKFKYIIENSLHFPSLYYGVGDARYMLSNKLMIPYPVEVQMTKKDSYYNYLHSKTRITVERTFGILKNRFRIFKSPLNQKADTKSGNSQVRQICRVIEACFVLHNILIDKNDELNDSNFVNNFILDTEYNLDIVNNTPTFVLEKRNQIRDYLYSNNHSFS